jgi:hypothetical protein
MRTNKNLSDTLLFSREYLPLFPFPFFVPGPSRQACPRQIATVTQASQTQEHLSPGPHSPHRTEIISCLIWSTSTCFRCCHDWTFRCFCSRGDTITSLHPLSRNSTTRRCKRPKVSSSSGLTSLRTCPSTKNLANSGRPCSGSSTTAKRTVRNSDDTRDSSTVGGASVASPPQPYPHPHMPVVQLKHIG